MRDDVRTARYLHVCPHFPKAQRMVIPAFSRAKWNRKGQVTADENLHTLQAISANGLKIARVKAPLLQAISMQHGTGYRSEGNLTTSTCAKNLELGCLPVFISAACDFKGPLGPPGSCEWRLVPMNSMNTPWTEGSCSLALY